MIYQGNSLDVLRRLPRNHYHVVVTSPPYWSLRDYGVPPSIWGGDPACPHTWVAEASAEGYTSKRKWQHQSTDASGVRHMPTRSTDPEGWSQISQGETCSACGAWRGCLGLEPTPDLYVEHITMIFDEVYRVLRPDGTLWLNLGDCYAAARGGASGSRSTLEGSTASQEQAKAGQRLGHRSSFRRDRAKRMDVPHKTAPGLKPKDLVGVPWMVAFALRARGWFLRSDIIWAKTNPMPESIKDRPTKSHEYFFLLSKSEEYYYDAEAIREGVTGTAHSRGAGVHPKSKVVGRGRIKANASFSAAVRGRVSSRNRRTVWTLSTAPFAKAHFATFPPKLIAPCIQAGSSEHGCCSSCGAPFERIVTLGEPLHEQKLAGGCNKDGTYHGTAQKDYAAAGAQDPSAVKARILDGMRERITVGWRPTCRCSLRIVVPCKVLDPFYGSGTTGMVAAQLGRECDGIELNPDYIAMDRAPRSEASA